MDAVRMLSDLEFLASDNLGGRETGTPGSALARTHIVSAFQSARLRSFAGGFELPFSFGPDSAPTRGVNVVGYVPGSAAPGRYIVVTAHYDHLGMGDGAIFNGADDNGSGTAALLALARYVSDHPLRHSVIFAAFDAEEKGLQGARAFVANPPVGRDGIRLNLNMDMVSHSDSVLFAAGTHHYPFLRGVVARVVPRDPVVLRFGHDSPDLGSNDWTSASDHGPFHAAGIPFLYFGVEDHQDYHRVSDEFETINRDFYIATVETILAVLMEVDAYLSTNR
jgi:Zn-dependent M28 family amino/carboxypeptidase